MTELQEKSLPMVNGKTGEVLLNVPADSSRRVSRSKLRELFARGLDMRYGKKLARIEHNRDGKITAIFEDGEEAQGDVLVGCDGAHSVVRSILLRPEDNVLDPVPVTGVNITTSYNAEQAQFIRGFYHPIVKLAPHPDQHTSAIITMADIRDPTKPETWTFQLAYAIWGTHEQPTLSEERLKLLKSYAKNYCEPFKSAAMWLPDDTFIPPDVYSVWTKPVKRDNWNGRVTLAGDAAHPISPYRGQGLNNAVQDAALFVERMGKLAKGVDDLKSQIDQYDLEVLDRAKREVVVNNAQTYGSHHWDTLMNSPVFKHGIRKVNGEN